MPHVRTATVAVVLLSLIAAPIGAAVDFYRFSELVRHKDVRDDLDPDVRLYFVGDALPAFAERARPDVYSGHGISISPFGGSPRHCIEAFDEAMVAMIRDAKVGPAGPAYRERYGPSAYGESVVVGSLGAEEACRQAVIRTIASIVEDADEKKYDTVLRLRSFQDDEYAPDSPNVDCQVGCRNASVKLQASLATRQ